VIVHIRWNSGPELLFGERQQRRVNRRRTWNLIACLFPSHGDARQVDQGHALTTRIAHLLDLCPQYLDACLDRTDVRLAEFIDELGPRQSGDLGSLAPGNHAPVIPEDGESQPSAARDILVRCTSRAREVAGISIVIVFIWKSNHEKREMTRKKKAIRPTGRVAESRSRTDQKI
jgi:hypothetical protein